MTPKKLQWIALAALFPLWGIGAMQLLVFSVHELAEPSTLASTQTPMNAAMSFFLSVGWLMTGIALTLRAVWMHQAERIPRLDKICRTGESGEENGDEYEYDSLPQLQARAADQLSYTRIWYLSFQNHLLAKSGFDTMKLTPLKRWPAILRHQLGEDIVPVWNLPLLLISVASIPVLAIFIAAVDVIFRGLTGVSFCNICFQIVNAIAMTIALVVSICPLLFGLLLLGGVALFVVLFVVPRLATLLLNLKVQKNNMQAIYSEMVLNSALDSPNSKLAGRQSGQSGVSLDLW
jgi:hypothetical protein